MTDYQNPYAAPPPPPDAPTGPPRTSGMSIWTLVLGLVGIFPCCFLVPNLVAVILGIVALSAIGRSAGQLTGRGLAWVGIIAAILSTVLWIGLGVALGPKAARFYPGMGQAVESSNRFFQALSDGDLDRAYREAGEDYRNANPRAAFEARVQALQEGRGTPRVWQPVDIDQTGWLSAREGTSLSTSIEYRVEWSEGGTSTVVLVWEWPWFDDFEKIPVPGLRSFETK